MNSDNMAGTVTNHIEKTDDNKSFVSPPKFAYGTAKKTGYDFVICNHQLLLADMKLRAEDSGAVLPPFQVLILDEAHKVLPAARSLYGSELSADAIPAVTKALPALNFAPLNKPKTDGWKTIRDTVCRLSGKLFEANKVIRQSDILIRATWSWSFLTSIIRMKIKTMH